MRTDKRAETWTVVVVRVDCSDEILGESQLEKGKCSLWFMVWSLVSHRGKEQKVRRGEEREAERRKGEGRKADKTEKQENI